MKLTSYLIPAILVVFSQLNGTCQSIERQEVSSLAINNQSIVSNAGGLSITTLRTDNLLITQGFLQGELSGIISGIDFIDISHAIEVYPNPAVDQVKLQIDQLFENGLSLDLIDLNGQSIINQAGIFKDRMDYDLNLMAIPSGQYIIRIHSIDKKYQGILKVLKIK